MLDKDQIRVKKALISILGKCMEKNNPKPYLNYVHKDGNTLVATDTRRMIIISGEEVETLFKGENSLIDIKNHYEIQQTDDVAYSDYKRIILPDDVECVEVKDWMYAVFFYPQSEFKSFIDTWSINPLIKEIDRYVDSTVVIRNRQHDSPIQFEFKLGFGDISFDVKFIVMPISR